MKYFIYGFILIFVALNVGGTPTVIFATRNGEILRTWMGKLSPEQETEVFNSLQ